MTEQQSYTLGLGGLRSFVEQRPQSPMVARLANVLTESGEHDAALQLCRRALEYFPKFPTLHFIIAKAQTAKHQFFPARKRLQQLLELHPACLAANRLLERIERLERQSLNEPVVKQKTVPEPALSFPEYAEKEKKSNWSWREYLIPGSEDILQKRSKDFEAESTVQKPEPAPVNVEPRESHQEQDDLSNANYEENVFSNIRQPSNQDLIDFDKELEELAGQLDSASMPRIDTPTLPDEESFLEQEFVDLESRPVTETLAEIYFRQGKYIEAIDAYRKLREKNRDKRYEYTVRISEIKRIIDDQQGRTP